jgi:hypothetical protein
LRATEGNPDKFEEDVVGTAHTDDSIDSGNRVFYDKKEVVLLIQTIALTQVIEYFMIKLTYGFK